MNKILALCLLVCCSAFYKPKVRDTNWFYGDSIMLGNELPNFSYRWSAVYSRNLGFREENHAGSGMTMEPGLGRPSFDVTDVPEYDGGALRMFLAFGANDIFNGGNVTNYASATQAAVTGIMAKGWPADKIVLVWDWLPSVSASVNIQWLTALKNVAIAKGTSLLDFYTPLSTDPNNSSYTDDSIHPNIQGNIKYASLTQTNISNPSAGLTPSIKVSGRKSRVS